MSCVRGQGSAPDEEDSPRRNPALLNGSDVEDGLTGVSVGRMASCCRDATERWSASNEGAAPELSRHQALGNQEGNRLAGRRLRRAVLRDELSFGREDGTR